VGLGSRGTFSVIARDEPLAQVLAAIHEDDGHQPFVGAGPAPDPSERDLTSFVTRRARPEVGVEAWITENGGKELVVIAGEPPSMRRALLTPLPAYTGVAARVKALRAKLVPLLALRAAARARPGATTREIRVAELAADKVASEIASVLEHVAEVEAAPAKLAVVSEELDRARKDLDLARPPAARAQAAWRELAPGLEGEKKARTPEQQETRIAALVADQEILERETRVSTLEKKAKALEAAVSEKGRLEAGEER
jgi:hypothetical protein